MCGFAGEFVFAGPARADLNLAEAMAGRLAHRGPDQVGSFLSPDGRCAIGFRRLAVIDPPLSRQPMAAEDASAVVAFNGEIYNFRELREELTRAGAAFRTRGDTEVLLALWRDRGADMLEALEGMFAFAIYDAAGRLFLARDRLGQKPLWYAVLSERIVFASEAKALLRHPRVGREVDPSAVGMYLTLGYVPAPRSIWRDLKKLPPGCCMLVDAAAPEPRRYWDLPERTEPVARAEAAGVEHLVQDVVHVARKRDRRALAEKGREARLFARWLAETSSVQPGDVVAHRAGRVTVYRPLNGKGNIGNGKRNGKYRIALVYLLRDDGWEQQTDPVGTIISRIRDRRRIVVQ